MDHKKINEVIAFALGTCTLITAFALQIGCLEAGGAFWVLPLMLPAILLLMDASKKEAKKHF